MVNIISSKIDKSIANALLGVHAISGRDSCKQFHVIRKVKWFKKVSQSEYYQSVPALLAEKYPSDSDHSIGTIIEQFASF